MKKIFSTVLLCILVLTMSATVFAADCNYLLTVDSTELTPGDVVTLTIKLDTNPGIANYKNVVTFDSKVFERTTITYVNSDDEEVTEDIKTSWGGITINDAQAGKTIMSWTNSSNKTGKTVATMCYKVKADAPNGTYSFTLVAEEAFNASYAPVSIGSATSSNITITGGAEAGGNEPTYPEIKEDEVFEVGEIKDKEGNTFIETTENTKSIAVFGKAATALDAKAYGVKITMGGKVYTFPGLAPVAKDQLWAVKVITPDGSFNFKDGAALADYTVEAY